jgi:predicted negative regulator of RcsB-dependent stress response
VAPANRQHDTRMAIDDLLDEHEQSEKVRTWLKDNGAGLIGGVVLGLGLIAGWQWWQGQQLQGRVQAAERYQSTLDQIHAGKLGPAKASIAALSGSVYATLANLDLAKAQLDAGQPDAAIASLRQVKPDDAALSTIVNQRLARLLIDAGKAGEAVQLLPATSADPVSLQILGDAQAALGHKDAARAAYARALGLLDADAPQRRLVELKLSEVGGVPAQPEAKT